MALLKFCHCSTTAAWLTGTAAERKWKLHVAKDAIKLAFFPTRP
jgi:hypothetical protein